MNLDSVIIGVYAVNIYSQKEITINKSSNK